MLRSVVTLIRRLIRSALIRTHTCMPAIVVAFDRDNRTADVQPAPQRKLVGQDWSDMQVIRNCPVAYPAGGGFSVTWDLEAGDAVMLIFAERNLLGWTGGNSLGTYSPNDLRTHDLNDAWVVPAGPPSSVPLEAAADQLIMGKQDGSTKVTIDRSSGTVEIDSTGDVTVNAGGDAKVYGTGDTLLGAAAPTQFVALAALVLVELNKITAWNATHVHPFVGLAPGVPGVTTPSTAPQPTMTSPAATKTKAQ